MSDFATQVAIGLSEGRALAESLMTDTCTITRAGTGKGAWNESTGQYDTPARSMVYTGKCRIQIKSIVASSSESDAGERASIAQEFELQLPIAGTDTVAIHDVAEVTAAAHDDSLVGRKFTVTARHEKSQATARRLRVVEGTA